MFRQHWISRCVSSALPHVRGWGVVGNYMLSIKWLQRWDKSWHEILRGGRETDEVLNDRWGREKAAKTQMSADDGLQVLEYSHSNCCQPLTHQRPSTPHTIIIVVAGSFTGKVITLRPPRLFAQALWMKFPSVHIIPIRPQHPTIYHPLPASSPSFGELSQLNKQDYTNFNLLGGHAVKFRDVDMAVIVRIVCVNYGWFHSKTFSSVSRPNGLRNSASCLPSLFAVKEILEDENLASLSKRLESFKSISPSTFGYIIYVHIFARRKQKKGRESVNR